jgi:drug/metabolite transporter (DMT)-like permease
MRMKKTRAILYAILAAAFYAVNIPVSKLLLDRVGAITMAALLYLGAGIGIGIVSLFDRKEKREKLMDRSPGNGHEKKHPIVEIQQITRLYS